MKLHTMVGLVSLSLLGLTACEAGGEQTAEQPAAPDAAQQPGKEGQPAQPGQPATPAPTEPAKPEVAPGDVCKELTTAAKAGDEAKLATLVDGDLAAEGAKDHLVGAIGGGTCGEAKVDGDKATVPVKVGEGKKAAEKELAFAKADGAWKLDLAAFAAKYPADAKGKKAKGKKAKGKKAKG